MPSHYGACPAAPPLVAGCGVRGVVGNGGQVAAWDKHPVDATEEGSYYERQQRKYGRSRRGSTSFHGAFDLFFMQAAAAAAARTEEAEEEEVCFCCLFF